QSVMPGRTIKKNQNVEVTVSNGPKLVEIDDYSGKPIDDVISMLTKQDLKYDIIRQEDDTVQSDCVIKTNPAAREFVQVGTTVTLWVSTGASDETTAVPQLVNLSLASARQRAQEYDILLTELYEPSNDVEEGKVIRQNIDPTTIVEKNTMVEIVISSGGAQERQTSIKINIKGSASGEFEFKYYIDGTLQENMSEVKNLSLIDSFEWPFANSGVHEYAVRVKSVDNGAEATFFSCLVDFTKDPPTKDYGEDNKNFNPKVFKQLLSAVPAEDENSGSDSSEEDNRNSETENTDNENEDTVSEEEIPVLPEDDDNRVIAEG
ncbi:MAG: PASTA domain-containing protein, partial [Ruminiclostridium sp.]|nr:PASTA domain-containing protein [Ruminiclostridium sp.]